MNAPVYSTLEVAKRFALSHVSRWGGRLDVYGTYDGGFRVVRHIFGCPQPGDVWIGAAFSHSIVELGWLTEWRIESTLRSARLYATAQLNGGHYD